MIDIDTIDATVWIDGTCHKLVRMFDGDLAETKDPYETRRVLYQRFEDIRPEGTKQTFLYIDIDEGAMFKHEVN